MATAHDERMKEFNRLIDAAARMLKIKRAAQEALSQTEDAQEEKGITGEQKT